SSDLLHRAARHPIALAPQLLPDLAYAVDLLVLVPDSADLLAQRIVPPRTVRAQLRVDASRRLRVVRRRGDRQHLADRLDPVDVAVFVDERRHGLNRRSSPAWAKYALALRRISFACRNSRFSRSSALIRSVSLVVGPGRLPWSRSACRTQRRSVSDVQPIFPAMDPIAAHCEPCSCWCSSTSRTARSCTSGENFADFLMAPSSQGKEPPEKPGRFTPRTKSPVHINPTDGPDNIDVIRKISCRAKRTR